MSTLPRILFFIETGGPGGAERVVLELMKGFRTLGAEVALSTLRQGWLTESALKEGFPYFPILSDRRLDVTLPLRLSRVIKLFRADVLHTHLLDSNFYGALASKIAHVRHIGTEHGDVHHVEKKKFLQFKLKVATSGASLLTSVSEFSAQRLRSLGVHAERIRVVPNPMPELQPLSESRRALLREEFSLSGWVWAHVGNLRPVKDQKTLIRAFSESHKQKLEQHLLIIGDGPERKALEALRDEEQLGDSVHFLGHRNNVHELLGIADGFIMTSISESMPMALLEAISAGCFPLSSAVGGVPEILNNEQLFPATKSDALALLMNKALETPEATRTKALQLREREQQKRSLDAVLQAYLKLYGTTN